MEKRGGRGRQASREFTRPAQPFSPQAPRRFVEKADEKQGLGAVDLMSIVLVIAFLGLAFGTLVAARSQHLGTRSREWVERITAPLNSWVASSEAEEAAPSVTQPAR